MTRHKLYPYAGRIYEINMISTIFGGRVGGEPSREIETVKARIRREGADEWTWLADPAGEKRFPDEAAVMESAKLYAIADSKNA
ncbi:hypothetical protein [Burkholderia gladioli]|uniref:hypothetical protein n=1 Tax=Burkholderia gladioli TaxID=28095 RepID=UPI0016421E24|nr:hypothetical protein [Burkholderia gladioli]